MKPRPICSVCALTWMDTSGMSEPDVASVVWDGVPYCSHHARRKQEQEAARRRARFEVIEGSRS